MTAPTTTAPSAPAQPAAPTQSPMAEALERAREALTATTETPDVTPAQPTQPAAPTIPAAPAAPAAPTDPTKPAEPEQPATPGEEQEAERPELLVEIAPRGGSGTPIKVQFGDVETADLVRSAINNGMRRDEFHRQMDAVNQQRDELEQFTEHLRLDPVGFIIEGVRPDLQAEVARHLMSIPAVFEQVSKEIEGWDDPDRLGRRQAELQRDRLEQRGKTERELTRSREAREQGRQVRVTVDKLIPDGMDETGAGMFRDDCLNDLANYVRANPHVRSLRPDEIVNIVDRRLRYYGVTPESALAALSSGQPPRRPPAAHRASTVPAPRTPDVDTARTTGATLKEAGELRRAIAAVPGAGAGARPTTIEPPPKQGVRDRIAFLKQQITGKP